MGQARCSGLPSLRTEAVLLQLNTSPPPCRSTRPGCEWGRLGVLVCLRFAPRRCSYNRTRHPHPVGAPAPGANKAGSVYWFDSVRTEAVLLQSNAPPHLVGASAPGANKAGSVYWFDSVRTEAVLLQSNAPPHLVGASAPGANNAGSVYWFDSVRTEAVLLQSNASPPPCRSTRPGCE